MSIWRRIAASLIPFQAKLLLDVFDSADGHFGAMRGHHSSLSIQSDIDVRTLATRAVEFGALAFQLPLELATVHR